MSTEKMTMRMIARMAGTSAVTVSKALAGKSGVSDELRRKILKIAEDTGYTLPKQAHDVKQKPLEIGILIPDRYFGPESFYAVIYKKLVRKLSDLGHFGTLEILDPEYEHSLILPRILKREQISGLILLGEPSKDYYRLIAQEHLPTVFMDFYDDQCSADAVAGDNTYGTYRLTSHLIRGGHTRIGFVGNIKTTSSIMDRFLGYSRAMLMHDLPVREEWIIEDRDRLGNMKPIVLPQELPTAFVCNCDLVAQSVIALLKERGCRVPEDVSVTGFDDFLIGPRSVPAISTFRPNTEHMVEIAVKAILDRCAGSTAPFSKIVVSGEPVYRDSECELIR